MRIWGRIYNEFGEPTWAAVQSNPVDGDDYVYVTNLIQVLKGAPGESPFFANYGIPAQRAVIQQVFPDYYVNVTQAQFSSRFASLIISKLDGPAPVYQVNLTTNQGVPVARTIPV